MHESTIFSLSTTASSIPNLDFEKVIRNPNWELTSHAITILTETIRDALDKNEFIVGTFIDLKKAFDTVDHDILIKKAPALWYKRNGI